MTESKHALKLCFQAIYNSLAETDRLHSLLLSDLMYFYRDTVSARATSITWTRTLDPDTGPGPLILDPDPGPGPWTRTRTRTLKTLILDPYPEKPRP